MANDYCALKGYMWHHNSLRSIICGINLVPDDSNLRNGIISPLSRLSRWNIKSSWDKRTNEMIKWNRFEKLTIIYNYYSGFLLVLIQVTLPMRILEGVKFTVSRYQSKVWGFSRQHLPSLWIVIYEVLSVSWMKNINLSVVGVSLKLQCWQIIIDKCQRSLWPVQHKAWTEFMNFWPHFDETMVMIILYLLSFMTSWFHNWRQWWWSYIMQLFIFGFKIS